MAKNLIEAISERYWNSFRDGFLSVGGDRNYPLWKESNDPVKVETMRCMRHGLEALRKLPDSCFVDDDVDPEERVAVAKMNRGKFNAVLDRAFPDKPIRRRDTPETMTEMRLARTLGRKPK